MYSYSFTSKRIYFCFAIQYTNVISFTSLCRIFIFGQGGDSNLVPLMYQDPTLTTINTCPPIHYHNPPHHPHGPTFIAMIRYIEYKRICSRGVGNMGSETGGGRGGEFQLILFPPLPPRTNASGRLIRLPLKYPDTDADTDSWVCAGWN